LAATRAAESEGQRDEAVTSLLRQPGLVFGDRTLEQLREEDR
jgi:hypothetical protein